MDRELEDLQFLGLFGIYKESFKIIFSWPKIFIKITLALILPLTFIFLAHIQVSHLFFSKIMQSNRLLNPILWEWVSLLLFEVASLIFLLIFSLLSTSSVVYSIASIYTTKELTFKKVMAVVPNAWKRLMVTYLWTFSFIFLYNAFVVVMLVLFPIFTGLGPLESTRDQAVVIVPVYQNFYGIFYIIIVLQLASVISVLEDFKGMQAMKKGKALIEGKEWVANVIILKLVLVYILIQFGFVKMVVHGENLGMGIRVLSGIVCFLLFMQLFLLGLVVQSVFYFVCKSYHHENINRSILGESVPLNGKDNQLEQCDV